MSSPLVAVARLHGVKAGAWLPVVRHQHLVFGIQLCLADHCETTKHARRRPQWLEKECWKLVVGENPWMSSSESELGIRSFLRTRIRSPHHSPVWEVFCNTTTTTLDRDYQTCWRSRKCSVSWHCAAGGNCNSVRSSQPLSFQTRESTLSPCHQ
jgi:hypothetical protein